jgi:CheY-like chemotaxis protein
MTKDLILIVDDNESILFNLSILLELNNYDIQVANNGNQALEILSNSLKEPDLILSDILMPEMDGYELLEKISKNPKWNHIPFLFLSAKTYPEDIKIGKLLGADDYITKPFDEEISINNIQKRIQKHKLLELKIQKEFDTYYLTNEWDDIELSLSLYDSFNIDFLVIQQNDQTTPNITHKFSDPKLEFDLESVALSLYNSTISFYEKQENISPEILLINLKDIQKNALLFFDELNDVEYPGNQKRIMVCIIAPFITVLDSLKLKRILLSLTSKIKESHLLRVEDYFQQIQSILIKAN